MGITQSLVMGYMGMQNRAVIRSSGISVCKRNVAEGSACMLAIRERQVNTALNASMGKSSKSHERNLGSIF